MYVPFYNSNARPPKFPAVPPRSRLVKRPQRQKRVSAIANQIATSGMPRASIWNRVNMCFTKNQYEPNALIRLVSQSTPLLRYNQVPHNNYKHREYITKSGKNLRIANTHGIEATILCHIDLVTQNIRTTITKCMASRVAY